MFSGVTPLAPGHYQGNVGVVEVYKGRVSYITLMHMDDVNDDRTLSPCIIIIFISLQVTCQSCVQCFHENLS